MIPAALDQQDATSWAPHVAMMMTMDHDSVPIEDGVSTVCRRNHPSVSYISRGNNHVENHSTENGIRSSSNVPLGILSSHQQNLVSFAEPSTRASLMTNDSTPKRKRLFHDDTHIDMGSTSSSTASRSPASRRRRRYTTSTKHQHDRPMDCCYQLPMTLQNIMEEEYTWITQKGFHTECGTSPHPLRKLHHLPATVTIQHVLEHFQNKYLTLDEEIKKNQIQRFCSELEQWCEHYLATLLYPEEIPQYQWIMKTMTTMGHQHYNLRACQVYGCHILLRLVVKAPPSLSHLLSDSLLVDLIALLQKNRQVCFRRSYRKPMQEELLDWEKTITVMEKPLLDWDYAATPSTMAIMPTTGRQGTTRTLYPNDQEEHPEIIAMSITPPKKKRFDVTDFES